MSRRLIMLAAVLLFACGDPVSPTLLTSGGADARATSGGLTVTTYANITNGLAWPDNATNEAGWEVQRSTTGANGVFTLLASLSANATAFGDVGLMPATQYCYRVRSFRNTGKNKAFAAFSAIACVTTFPRPAAPTDLRGTPKEFGVLELTWAGNSTGQTDVHRAAEAQGLWQGLGSVSSNTTTFLTDWTHEALTCYRVLSWNEFNVQSPPSNVICTGQPRAPIDVSAAVSGGSIVVAWTDHSSIEDGYEVWRSSDGAAAVRVATPPANATTHTDATVVADVIYRYHLRATRDGGFSSLSSTATAGYAASPPAAPQGVSASPAASTMIAVSWTVTPLASSYRIERSLNRGVTWSEAGTVPDTAGLFYDSATPEDTVHYRVVAINAYGESAPSQTDFTAAPNTPTPTAADTYGVSWIDNSNVEDGYQVWTCTIVDCFETWTTGPDATWGWSGGLAARAYLVAAIRDGGYSDFAWISLPDFSVSNATKAALIRRAVGRRGIKP